MGRTAVAGPVLALVLAVTAGCTSDGSAPDASPPAGSTDGSPATGSPAGATTTGSPGQACRRDYTPRPLPVWARTGFTPPTLPMPYVVGDAGDIVAILWSDHDPLVAHPGPGGSDKILWVARVSPVGALTIRASLAGSGTSVTRTVDGGPGPSIVDLPEPGCWSLDLTWANRHDHVQLEYAPS